MSKKIKVYDDVWVMSNNEPIKLKVFARIESMSFLKNGVDVHYRLVQGIFGTGWGNHEGFKYSEDKVFMSKEELMKSL